MTFVLAVAALVLALWPVVADAPWEDGVVEVTVVEASKEEKEAERVAKCETAKKLKGTTDKFFADQTQAEVFSTLMENGCFSSP